MDDRRDRRTALLDPLPSEANYFLATISGETLTADSLTLALAKRGLLVRHCGSFRGMGNRHVRIGLKKRGQNQVLLDALKEITVESSNRQTTASKNPVAISP